VPRRDSIERLNAHLGSRLFRHIRQLKAVRADVRHLVDHNKMFLGIDCGLNIVATIPVSLPLVAIERASGSISKICSSSLFIISVLISPRRSILYLSFVMLFLNRTTRTSGTRITTEVGSLQLRYVARDALLNTLKTPPHLDLGEVLIACIDGLEFGTIDGEARLAQQIKLAAQRHEAMANLTNGLTVVLAEIHKGLEVRRQGCFYTAKIQCGNPSVPLVHLSP
jgi:hypothetical protein